MKTIELSRVENQIYDMNFNNVISIRNLLNKNIDFSQFYTDFLRRCTQIPTRKDFLRKAAKRMCEYLHERNVICLLSIKYSSNTFLKPYW